MSEGSSALAVRENGALAQTSTADPSFLMPAVPIEQMLGRYNSIVELTKRVLKKDVDYGVIPGTEKKNEDGTPSNRNNTLLKPGAEKLCSFFGLVPEFDDYKVIEDFEKGLFYYAYRCRLTRNCRLVASAIGSANSREKKYRRAIRTCPDCGAAAIKKSKYPPRGSAAGTPAGWYCEAKSGGCGRSFEADAPAIVGQKATTDPDDAADLVNTLQKMAQKRAHVAATLLATNASEFFTQDLEDAPIVDGDWSPAGEPQQGRRNRSPRGKEIVDPNTGEVVDSGGGTDGAAPPQQQPPAQPKLNVADNEIFAGEWKRRLQSRGFSREAAHMLLGHNLKKKDMGLDDVSTPGRWGLLDKVDKGGFDDAKDEFNRKAAGASEPNGRSSPAEKKDNGKEPAAGGDPVYGPEQVKDWAEFERLYLSAAEAKGVDEPKARKGLDTALVGVQRKGKQQTTTKEWRVRLLNAVAADAFDFATGKINQAEMALNG